MWENMSFACEQAINMPQKWIFSIPNEKLHSVPGGLEDIVQLTVGTEQERKLTNLRRLIQAFEAPSEI